MYFLMQDIIDVSMLLCTLCFSWEPCKCEATHMSMYLFPLKIYIYMKFLKHFSFNKTRQDCYYSNKPANPLQKGDFCVQTCIWGHICVSSITNTNYLLFQLNLSARFAR